MISCFAVLCIFSQIVWQNTGELTGAARVGDITQGLGGYIYAGTRAGPIPGSQDSGWVYVSQDFWNWSVTADLPGNQEGVYCLINGQGDTLFAGTGMWGDLPRVFKSSDGGSSWAVLNSYGTYRPGSRVTAFLEDNLGMLHLGNDYMGMSSAIPRRSLDRGSIWLVDSGTIYYNSMHYCLYQSSDNTIYFGSWGTGGGIHRSTNNGQAWSPCTALPGFSDSYAIIEVGADTVFVGLDSAGIGRIKKTADQGTTWSDVGAGYFSTTTSIRSLLLASDGMIFAGTTPNAEVFVSNDRGNTWISTGALSGATTVYKMIEARKTTGYGDSVFIFAATGANGDVFRALLYTVGIEEDHAPGQTCQGITVAPNPASGKTTIKFQIHPYPYLTPSRGRIEEGGTKSQMSMKIYNAAGRLVKQFNYLTIQLFNQVIWDGSDDIGRKLPAGVYVFRHEHDGGVDAGKLVIVE
ncbi:MAG TPA: hypothetical protein VF399_06900 [bacterium]